MGSSQRQHLLPGEDLIIFPRHSRAGGNPFFKLRLDPRFHGDDDSLLKKRGSRKQSLTKQVLLENNHFPWQHDGRVSAEKGALL